STNNILTSVSYSFFVYLLVLLTRESFTGEACGDSRRLSLAYDLFDSQFCPGVIPSSRSRISSNLSRGLRWKFRIIGRIRLFFHLRLRFSQQILSLPSPIHEVRRASMRRRSGSSNVNSSIRLIRATRQPP